MSLLALSSDHFVPENDIFGASTSTLSSPPCGPCSVSETFICLSDQGTPWDRSDSLSFHGRRKALLWLSSLRSGRGLREAHAFQPAEKVRAKISALPSPTLLSPPGADSVAFIPVPSLSGSHPRPSPDAFVGTEARLRKSSSDHMRPGKGGSDESDPLSGGQELEMAREPDALLDQSDIAATCPCGCVSWHQQTVPLVLSALDTKTRRGG